MCRSGCTTLIPAWLLHSMLDIAPAPHRGVAPFGLRLGVKSWRYYVYKYGYMHVLIATGIGGGGLRLGLVATYNRGELVVYIVSLAFCSRLCRLVNIGGF